jgi:hypothetical protein
MATSSAINNEPVASGAKVDMKFEVIARICGIGPDRPRNRALGRPCLPYMLAARRTFARVDPLREVSKCLAHHAKTALVAVEVWGHYLLASNIHTVSNNRTGELDNTRHHAYL